ncbi:hypothetical protein MUN84_04270 [Hymenobacter sp. 5516J-16]|uniref:hypothetical protein n=1 Tax=Hymenobacter sp. 5516J-16 TaxID=2932253 RepID=UPI001FD3FAFD|nr:hypothetical protein [Hymenobacter sp. 5516J-16]UOQ77871.1 hypothetical protein MUN84_04270 [Hymenobacter sp. 5516J-16]
MKNKDLLFSMLALGAGILLTVFAPYMLTRFGTVDFSQTGPIGDTIGELPLQ